jgi:hypothetical protein
MTRGQPQSSSLQRWSKVKTIKNEHSDFFFWILTSVTDKAGEMKSIQSMRSRTSRVRHDVLVDKQTCGWFSSHFMRPQKTAAKTCTNSARHINFRDTTTYGTLVSFFHSTTSGIITLILLHHQTTQSDQIA